MLYIGLPGDGHLLPIGKCKIKNVKCKIGGIKMNNSYLKFSEGEITVYCGDHARANVHGSLKQAREIARSSRKGNIMYVNTVFSTRKLLEAARLELGKTGGLRVRPTGETGGLRVHPT